MLLRLKAKNFLSFNEEVSFDMFPNLKRTTFQNHIYTDYEIPLLKQAAIYGANGSGKSNLIKAVEFVKSFATDKNSYEKHRIGFYSFLLKDDPYNNLLLNIEFHHDDHYFIYNIGINDIEVLMEELYLSGVGKEENELIYSRKGNNIKTAKGLNEDVEKAIMNVLHSNPKSSLMSLNNEFPILDDKVKIAYEWFEKTLKIKSLHTVNPFLIREMDQEPELLSFTNSLINRIGLGIEELEISEMKVSDLFTDDELQKLAKDLFESHIQKEGYFSQMQHDKVLYCVDEKNGEQMFKLFLFKQLGIGGFSGKLGFESQSDGTSKILNLIPVLYDLIHTECVYFIDEIENSIHPSLILALMKYFSQTESKGQLIYTTHETELLNQQELMRPDEVWFTEKDEGQTKLYSLNDFKEHNTINIRNGYLDGRYGAIPFIGNLGQ